MSSNLLKQFNLKQLLSETFCDKTAGTQKWGQKDMTGCDVMDGQT